MDRYSYNFEIILNVYIGRIIVIIINGVAQYVRYVHSPHQIKLDMLKIKTSRHVMTKKRVVDSRSTR